MIAINDNIVVLRPNKTAKISRNFITAHEKENQIHMSSKCQSIQERMISACFR